MKYLFKKSKGLLLSLAMVVAMGLMLVNTTDVKAATSSSVNITGTDKYSSTGTVKNANGWDLTLNNNASEAVNVYVDYVISGYDVTSSEQKFTCPSTPTSQYGTLVGSVKYTIEAGANKKLSFAVETNYTTRSYTVNTEIKAVIASEDVVLDTDPNIVSGKEKIQKGNAEYKLTLAKDSALKLSLTGDNDPTFEVRNTSGDIVINNSYVKNGDVFALQAGTYTVKIGAGKNVVHRLTLDIEDFNYGKVAFKVNGKTTTSFDYPMNNTEKSNLKYEIVYTAGKNFGLVNGSTFNLASIYYDKNTGNTYTGDGGTLGQVEKNYNFISIGNHSIPYSLTAVGLSDFKNTLDLSKSGKLKFTVTPHKPTVGKVASGTHNSIKFKFGGNYAYGSQLILQMKNGKTWKKVATITNKGTSLSTTDLFCTVKKLKPNTKYAFRLYGYDSKLKNKSAYTKVFYATTATNQKLAIKKTKFGPEAKIHHDAYWTEPYWDENLRYHPAKLIPAWDEYRVTCTITFKKKLPNIKGYTVWQEGQKLDKTTVNVKKNTLTIVISRSNKHVKNTSEKIAIQGYTKANKNVVSPKANYTIKVK